MSLNQNLLPAASSTFVIGAFWTSWLSILPPLGGKSTLWNATRSNLTLSPAAIVVLRGKKSTTSVPYGELNFF
jgi:hypothetical protein